MLVQSREAQDHVTYLEKPLSFLRKYKLKLNSGKCAFGVHGGRFLGFIVTQRGIEANPVKIKAILEKKAPPTINEVQQLTGRIVALSRFISKVAEKSLRFFKVLRKANNFEWDTSCQQAFEELKIYLAGLPLLVKPHQGIPSTYTCPPHLRQSALSSSTKTEENKCRHITLVRYSTVQRDLYSYREDSAALVVTAKRLRPYFLSHPIGVRQTYH
ncbi:UNVERIFIED_CONTAM: hypothetical protein Sradi_7104200 [Sesamum radiatum]|uniref:Reverse transcriptase/retrotransposon-derived protein RNase H-like domain-containing protein n=1 Tax=Sesamum radiatum TaxID=300843 RepID=A0AAW2J2F7_SESRA